MRLSFYSGLLFAVLLAEDEWAANAIRMTTDDAYGVQDLAQTDATAEADTESQFFHQIQRVFGRSKKKKPNAPSNCPKPNQTVMKEMIKKEAEKRIKQQKSAAKKQDNKLGKKFKDKLAKIKKNKKDAEEAARNMPYVPPPVIVQSPPPPPPELLELPVPPGFTPVGPYGPITDDNGRNGQSQVTASLAQINDQALY